MPVYCHACGRQFTPSGRSIPVAAASGYCDSSEPCDRTSMEAQIARFRHLWDEHDSTRYYTDPDGWSAHVASCADCRALA